MTTKTISLRVPPTHIVGIGASAGGLEPIEEFFQNMPTDSGAAFIIIQHLSRDFESMMEMLLGRYTDMPISVAKMGMEIEANHIYLNSAGQNVIVSGGRLMVTELIASNDLHLPIDIFLNSLALDYGSRAIAVILSGAGTDGSRGVRAIQHASGQVLVQDPDSAGFDGMPRSSIGSAITDAIVTPTQMPTEILAYIANGTAKNSQKMTTAPQAESWEGTTVGEIIHLLQSRFNLDFTAYKPTTIERRIERRMALTYFSNTEEYVNYLKSHSEELDHLYRDMLVDVTHFFRDQAAFDFVAGEVIPEIVTGADVGDEIRIWVAGCASGEEAYSFGILILEELERLQKNCAVRIFATDAHQESIDRAALGIYDQTSCAPVSPERLERFFIPVKGGYQVVKKLRDIMIFAHQDLLNSSPFTRLDLISCRNVLIYFENHAQQRLLSNFHFALKTDGLLFLGPSEHLGILEDEFGILDRKWRVFRKLRDVMLPSVHITMPPSELRSQKKHLFLSVDSEAKTNPQPTPPKKPVIGTPNKTKSADWMESLLMALIPSGLVLDQKSDILYIFGDAQQYLHLRLGYGTLSAYDLLDGDLVTALRLALAQILSGQEKVIIDSVQTRTSDGEETQVRITVVSLQPARNRTHRTFVGFEALDVEPEIPAKVIEMGTIPIEQVEQLQYELALTRETLQTSMEEQESTNEELSAANEELQASNEELSATNEELFTVNTEYQRSIGELTKLTTDMENLQNSANMGVIFLDQDMAIRQFTAPAAQVLGLVDADVGRSITRLTFFNLSIDIDELASAIATVLAWDMSNDNPTVELETALWGDRYYLLRVLPYVNELRIIEGVILSIIDISARRRAESTSQDLNRQLRTITDNSPVRIIKVDHQLKIEFANQKIVEYIGIDQEKAIGMHLAEVIGQDAFDVYSVYIEIALNGTPVNFDSERISGQNSETRYEIATLVPEIANENATGFFAYIHDVTEHKMASKS